jgi:uncharacterized protein (DUF1015 family)
MPRTYPGIALQVPQVYLPRSGVDLTRWAVIACDQYTSQPEYWRQVDAFVGQAPSTLNLVLPETYLESPDKDQRIDAIHQTMQSILDQDILELYEGFVYVERKLGNRIRRGLLAALDLEQYDYQKGFQGLIRATEGTILERLPPRIQVRQGSVLELPHILVLIDDPEFSVIEPVSAIRSQTAPLYDFDLMGDSGHLSAWLVNDLALESGMVHALQNLIQPDVFCQRYNLAGAPSNNLSLLYAVGDGNHSFAAAKVIWEQMKNLPGIPPDHPARYALVEIENIQDDALCFEPIHRVLFGLNQPVETLLQHYFGSKLQIKPCLSDNPFDEMVAAVDHSPVEFHAVGMILATGYYVLYIADPLTNLPVGSLQAFVDELVQSRQVQRIDYVHGLDVVVQFGAQAGNAGFYLPAMNKNSLFKTVILDGALPRKTFSMGEAHEKRFYMESRRITL